MNAGKLTTLPISMSLLRLAIQAWGHTRQREKHCLRSWQTISRFNTTITAPMHLSSRRGTVGSPDNISSGKSWPAIVSSVFNIAISVVQVATTQGPKTLRLLAHAMCGAHRVGLDNTTYRSHRVTAGVLPSSKASEHAIQLRLGLASNITMRWISPQVVLHCKSRENTAATGF